MVNEREERASQWCHRTNKYKQIKYAEDIKMQGLPTLISFITPAIECTTIYRNTASNRAIPIRHC